MTMLKVRSAAENMMKTLSVFRRKSDWWSLLFWISLTLIVFTSALFYNSQEKLHAEFARLERGVSFERDIFILMSNLKDVESGARGYALTGNERYLEHYRAGKPHVMRGLRNLERFEASDPRQGLSIEQLKRLSLSRIEVSDELVASVSASGSRTVRGDLAYLERGKALMDEIRRIVDRVVVDAERQNQTRRQMLQKQISFSSAIAFIVLVVSVLTLVIISIVVKKEFRRQIDIQQERKRLTAELKSMVIASAAELQTSNQYLDLVLKHIPDTVFFLDMNDYRYILWNHVTDHQEGPAPSDVIGQIAYATLPPETAALMRAADQEAMASGQPTTNVTENVLTPIGSRTLEYRRIPVQDSEGRWRYLLGIVRDVSDQRNLERQVRQIQRLDAVGHLTGGLAHDFNNLLAIILANCDLLREQIADGSESAEMADEVIAAAERGAELTRRLLAFSRQQQLQPRSIDLNERLPEIGTLLKRTLGEHIVAREKLITC